MYINTTKNSRATPILALSTFDLELAIAVNPVSGVETKQQLEELIAPSEGQRVYVENIDSTFVYKSGQWEQCGEDVILREGLASGKLFVNNVKVG